MNKFLKITLYIFIGILLIVSGLVGYIYANFDKIKSGAVQELNTYLKAPVVVQKIDISFWDAFPYVSLELSDVSIASTPANTNHPKLLDCKKLVIGFDFWDVFNGNYRFKKIIFDEGEVHLFVDEAGAVNYNILKPDSLSSSSATAFQLKKVEFRNTQFTFEQAPHLYAAEIYIKKMSFSGNFSSKLYEMKTQVNMMLKDFVVNGKQTKVGEDFEIKAAVNINRTNGVYKILEGALVNRDLTASIIGSMKLDSVWNYDLQLKQEKCKISYILSFLPSSMKQKLNGFTPEGNIGLGVDIKGVYSHTQKPLITFDCALNNGSLVSNQKSISVNGISFNLKGLVNMNTPEESYFDLKKLQANMAHSQVRADIHVSNFTRPECAVNYLIAGDLNDINPWVDAKMLTFKAGKFDAEGNIQTCIDDIQNKHYDRVNIEKFKLQLSQADFIYNRNNYNGLNIHASLDDGNLVADNIQLDINHEPVKLNIEVRDFLPYLFKGTQPFITATVSFDQLVLTSSPTAKDDTGSFAGAIPEFDLTLKGNSFKYNLHHLKNIKLSALYKDKQVKLDHTSFGIYDGEVDIEKLVFEPEKRVVVFEADIQKIDIKKMFAGLENFQQQTLTDKHISGTLSIQHLKASIPLNLQYRPIYSKMLLDAEMKIIDGRLQDFEPIYKLSRFVKVEELKDIRFAELKNKISVHDNIVYIPDMMIINNALNVQMSGSHSFDNVLDYHMKVLLKDVLLKKRKASNSDEFGEFEPAPDKGIYLYLYVKGPMDHLKFGYDRKSSRESIKDKFKEEKSILKDIFKKEFKPVNDKKLNPSKRDTTTAAPKIEWDDD